MTLAEKIELAGLIGGGLSFVVYAALQVWGNVIQKRALDATNAQTRVFEEQNEIMRAQGGSAMPESSLRAIPKAAPVIQPARLWPLIPMAVLFLVSAAIGSYELYDRHYKQEVQTRVDGGLVARQRQRNDQTKQIADLKAHLRDANQKIELTQASLVIANKELDTVRAEKKQRAISFLSFAAQVCWVNFN